MSAIAIVGMGARFAGANDLHAYWRLLLEGRDSFGPVPPDRWHHDTFYDANPRAIDKSYVPKAAFMADVKSFPAITLGLPPRRVEVMDPQQRLALELSLQAIQDSGRTPADMPERTGVFMGLTAMEYRVLMSSRVIAAMMASGSLGHAPADPTSISEAVERVVPSRPYTAPGALANMTAATIAQELDLHGPAFTVDAACTSSLIAITEAMRHLETHAVDAALAGGAYLNLTPEHHLAFTRVGAMSPHGECRPFDHRADGFAQGDGAGVVVLKRLADAERDGDRIYAIIRGYATNNDGKGTGPMAPVKAGQVRVIRDAWSRATDVSMAELDYVEAHGTGTAVGDVHEFEGLVEAMGHSVSDGVQLGSSKGNIGHTMSAAGVASVLRATLATYHGVIPPMAGFEAPKPELNIDATPFEIPTAPRAWRHDSRTSCVSAFGFGGTNAHVILTAGPALDAPAERPHLVLMSAPDADALQDLAARTADAIEADPRVTVAGVARAWSVRKALKSRMALVAGSRDELVMLLRAYASGEPETGTYLGEAGRKPPKVAFLYPGQGAQRTGMLSQARERFPVLADALAELEDQLGDVLPVPLTHLLYPELRDDPVSEDEATEILKDTANTQPVLLSVGVALTRLLELVGVRPHVVTGHSLGEFTAAAAAGVLEPADAARFVAERGRAMADIPGDHGAMCALRCGREEGQALLIDGAILANINHPRQVVASGTTGAIDRLVERATAQGVKVKKLPVSHGFHSPVLYDIDSASILEGVAISDPKVPVISAITTRPYADAAEARDVFLRHAVSPVDFMGALHACTEHGAELYLQVGAGGPLAAFARGTLAPGHKGIVSLGSKEDADGGRSLLVGLGRLWAAGVPVDVTPITDPAPVASVPAAVLPREVYWAISDKRRYPLKLEGVVPTERPAEPEPAPVVTVVDASTEGEDEVVAKVMAVVAKVSAYPLDALRPGMGLIEDLGFDSLMVGDLATYLADAFPGLGGLPQELLINSPSVQDIIDFVEGSSGEVAEIDDDAPLGTWSPAWVPAPVPVLPARETGARVQVIGGPVPGLAEALAPLGASLVESEPDLLVYTALEEAPPVNAVLAGEAPWPDYAGDLADELGLVAARRPDVLVLRRTDDPWAEALSGAARSLAREWATSLVKAVAVDDHTDTAAALVAEWSTVDHTADVRYLADVRHLARLEPVEAPANPWAPGADDVVLVTGGTGDLGRLVARDLLNRGSRVVLVSRSAPTGAAATLLEHARASHVAADVADRDTLVAAVSGLGVTAVVHCAGVLADGAVEEVPAERGALVRAVKVDGWLNSLVAAGPTLRVAVGVGSLTGRFGNRHQVHYGAANALLAELSRHAPRGVRASVGEYGPWTASAMTASIPAPIQAAMREAGVDFVGEKAGHSALLGDLAGAGIRVHGRDLPTFTRRVKLHTRLSTETHPYLLDHAIEGTPVLPLAGAADLLAAAAAVPHPFQVADLSLFQGVTVAEPVDLEVSVDRGVAELRIGSRRTLAYRASVRPAAVPEVPAPSTGGEPPELALRAFYDDVTFHGPLLQGITAIDAVGADFVRGRVRTGDPAAWSPGTVRDAFAVDPLVLDSAMQLSAYVAWTRFHRAGTPVGIERLVLVRPLPAGELIAEVRFSASDDSNRFEGTVVLRDDAGELLLLAEGVVAELRKVGEQPEPEPEVPPFEIKPEWVDPSTWREVKDLELRLQGAKAIGLRNPYFQVHDGTAKNVTSINGREFVNYSSYNYLGLSGDPRVIEDVKAAVERYGTSVSASRVASGERPFHGELERKLAACQGADAALTFTAGHATNMNAIGHLMGPNDLVIHDELIHDSILQGIFMSGAKRRSFRHDDPEHLEHELEQVRASFEKVLVTVEGVYSMDGDICQLPAYIDVKERYGCLLMVDEAHSFGIVGATGQGMREHFGIQGDEVDLWMGTLSKSLASCGGWLAGSEALITYLRYTAPGFVYSAGLSPANGVAALRSLELMLEEPWRVQQLQSNAHFFHDALDKLGIDTGTALGGSGVVPAVTGNSMHALVLSQRLSDQGINVQPIVYPAVADDAARLRFFLSSTHTEEQLAWTAERVAETLVGVRERYKL